MKLSAQFRFLVGGGRVLLLAATITLCVGVGTALGTTYIVNSTGDGDNVALRGTICSDATGHCTLRGAIQASNNGAGADSISLKIPTSGNNCDAAGNCIINLTKALPDISDAVSINGPGADKLTVQNPNPQNTNAFRIFNVTTSGTVSFSGITITNGDVFSQTDYLGAGIQNYNAGIVNVTNCTIKANDAHRWFDQLGNVGPLAPGGGVANRAGGTINITSSTLDDNSADFGGGIYNSSTGITNVTNSTVSNNTAGIGGGIYNIGTITITNSTLHDNDCFGQGNSPGSGGGIYNFAGTVNLIRSTLGPRNVADYSNGGGIFNDDSGTVNVINSTIFFNTADGHGTSGTGNGGGLYNKATLNVSNSTIALNTISGGNFSSPIFGGGIYNDSAGVATVKSSIIAHDESITGSVFGGGFDVHGSFNSQGYNLIGVRDDSTGFTTATDQTGTCAGPDPQACNAALDPNFDFDSQGMINLADNGGRTKTIALLCGSPAIDKGTSAGLTGNLTVDQRGTGFARTVDDSGLPNAAGGDGTDIGAFEYGAGPIMPTSVVSRKYHGTGNPPPHFDIPLPLSCSSRGIECRRNTASDTAGPNAGHDHELIITFGSNVTLASVAVAPSYVTATYSVSSNVVTIDLHGVLNAGRDGELNINLRGVSDGTNLGFVSIPMGVLLGDVNGSGDVDSADVFLVRQQTLHNVTDANFREDINASGDIDSADVFIARKQTLTSLP